MKKPIKIRKKLPSHLVCERIEKPRKGKGSFKRRPRIKKNEDTDND